MVHRGLARRAAGMAILAGSVVAPGIAETHPAAAVPTQSQVDATQAELLSLEQTISQQQAQGAVLDQHYDAAVQQVHDLQAQLAAIDAQIASTRQHLAAVRAQLVRAALNAYVYGTPLNATTALFTSPATNADARTMYEDAVVGDLTGVARTYATLQSHLQAEQARQQAQQQQATATLAEVQSLRAANEAATQQAQATLTSVQGQLAQQLAQVAVAKAQQEAAAAAAAQDPASAQAAAAAAAGAASVASTFGDSGEAAAAAAAANQAAAAARSGPPVPVAGSATGSPAGAAAVAAAVSQLGVPYVWGGDSPSTGFDCSGLTQWAWAQAHVAIPRVAADQWAALPHVSLSALQPGDLLFYYNLDGDLTVDHVVMYVGTGPYGSLTVIQAPHTGATVSYSPLYVGGLIGAARP
ncbi:MAG TPA: NlpC/P60 family protein [Acidimicrobiales bacterium]|nr:NlpC/P60 family protein [Acidimicrobiales bacterium]